MNIIHTMISVQVIHVLFTNIQNQDSFLPIALLSRTEPRTKNFGSDGTANCRVIPPPPTQSFNTYPLLPTYVLYQPFYPLRGKK